MGKKSFTTLCMASLGWEINQFVNAGLLFYAKQGFVIADPTKQDTPTLR